MPRKATNKPMVAESAQEAAVEVVKKKKGGRTASVRHNTNATKAEISAIIGLAHQAAKQPRVKDDDECRQRISDYFGMCAENGVVPMWEELALYIGVCRDTAWDWLNGRGCSQDRCDMMKKAKLLMATIEGRLALGNRTNVAAYIFRAKNFFDMKDQQEVVLTPNNPLGALQDQKALEERLADVIVDE